MRSDCSSQRKSEVDASKGSREWLERGPGLERDIARVTGIPEEILGTYESSADLSVDQKLEWIEGRKTSREEDMSYALYGILGVTPGAN